MKQIYFTVIVLLLHSPFSSGQWSSQNSGIGQDIYSIFFIDENYGWAVGWNGRIIVTTDGGTNWAQQSSGIVSTLNDVFFISPSVGWIAGDGGKLLKTINGGVNWVQQTTFTSVSLISVHFANENIGWVCGDQGKVFKTTNGGTNWTAQPTGLGTNYALFSIHFFDSQIGWTTGGSFINNSCSILKTTNGGTNWVSQSVPTTKVSRASSFPGELIGYSVGDDGTVLKTTNGGSNWFLISTPTTDWLYSVFFINENIGWIGTGSGTIYKTNDGGSNWTQQPTGITNRINSLYFISPAIGWAGCDAGIILKHYIVLSSLTLLTPNGGESWEPGSNQVIGWESSYVVNVDIDYSTDNGNNWLSIIDSYPADSNAYDWDVPNTPSTNCILRIYDSDNLTINDLSDSVFTILKPDYGDVDLNSLVQAYDASLILKYLTGMINLNNQQKYNANVSGDTSISAMDASLILRYVIGLIDSLPNTYNKKPSGKIVFNNYLSYPNDEIIIPLKFSNCSDVVSFEGVIKYDAVQLKFLGMEWVESVESFFKESNIDNNLIRFAGFNITESSYVNGVIANLKFKINNRSSNNAILLQQMRFNEEAVKYNLDSLNLNIKSTEYEEIAVEEFALYQNYPNPFNPSTTIKFGLPKDGMVTLEVYNIIGEKVATLINQELKAGYHNYQFSINNYQLSSGIYLYRLTAGEFTSTKKFVLMK